MVQRTISPTQTEWTLETIVDAVTSSDDTVIVESQGQPKAAVISFERFQKLREMEKDAQREGNMRWLREFEASYDGRNDDLSEAQIDDLADRFSREFVDDLVAEGKIRFADDTHE